VAPCASVVRAAGGRVRLEAAEERKAPDKGAKQQSAGPGPDKHWARVCRPKPDTSGG